MIDASTPLAAKFNSLLSKLAAQSAQCTYLDSYYVGENGIPITATKATRESYRRLMSMARLNMAELVVEAVRERMQPVGFRTGAEPDTTGDQEAWRIWQANSLDADSSIVHRAMLSMSKAFVMVGPVDAEMGAPLITIEDPRQIVVELDPMRRRRVLHALKVYRDDDNGKFRAYLYVTSNGRVWVQRATRPMVDHGASDMQAFTLDRWDWDGDPAALPIPVVPIVPFMNQADNFGRSYGEYEKHLAILNRINFSILTRLEIATLQAFRQRAAKGLPNVDSQGNEINYDDIFSNDPGALWLLPANAEMWESGQVDLTPVRAAIRDDVQDLAATTRTPLFYLDPAASQGSAEGASLSREGLIFKTTDRITSTGESWEQVMSLAFRFAGMADRADRVTMEVLWAPPERYSLTERSQAASMAFATQVPWRTVMSDIWQFSPQQIDRMEAERGTDLLLGADVPAPADVA